MPIFRAPLSPPAIIEKRFGNICELRNLLLRQKQCWSPVIARVVESDTNLHGSFLVPGGDDVHHARPKGNRADGRAIRKCRHVLREETLLSISVDGTGAGPAHIRDGSQEPQGHRAATIHAFPTVHRHNRLAVGEMDSIGESLGAHTGTVMQGGRGVEQGETGRDARSDPQCRRGLSSGLRFLKAISQHESVLVMREIGNTLHDLRNV